MNDDVNEDPPHLGRKESTERITEVVDSLDAGNYEESIAELDEIAAERHWRKADWGIAVALLLQRWMKAEISPDDLHDGAALGGSIAFRDGEFGGDGQ